MKSEFKKQTFTTDANNSFELYLEGIKIPFSAITISESEDSYPLASITFPATAGALRILGGTIVQIFGPGLVEDEKTKTRNQGKIILFEGAVKSYNYQKTVVGRMVVLSCESLLSSFENAKLLPVDSLLTTEISSSMHLNKIHIHNQASFAPDNITNLDELVAQKNQAKDWTGEMKDISLKNTLGGLAQEILKLLEKPNAAEGDYFNIFHKVEAYFEVYDLLYGATAGSFNIRASLLAMPNPKQKEMQSAFRTKLTQASLANLKATYGQVNLGNTNQITLKLLFDEILQILHYTLIRPAAFPYVHRFYTNADNKGPIRAIISPELDMSPPVLCNVFFPDQVEEFQFAKDLKNEVTRVITQAPLGQIDNTMFKMFYPVYVAPSLSLKPSGGSYQSGLTVEETYRGVVPKYVELDRSFYAALLADMKGAKDTGHFFESKKDTKVEDVVRAIAAFESGGKSDSLSVKNNNPGAHIWLEEFAGRPYYAKKEGPGFIGSDKKRYWIAKYDTYEQGRKVSDIIIRRKWAKTGDDLSLFVHSYADVEYGSDEHMKYMNAILKAAKQEPVTVNNLNDAGTIEGLGINPEEWDIAEGQLGKLFTELTMLEYAKAKMQSKLFSMTCEWSPYRMIGTPALFIDKNGPSITGTIESIITQLDSQGQAKSSITFRNAKLIYDNEFDSAFFKLPDEAGQEDISVHVLKDFVTENFIGAASLLYDSALYSAYTIGLDAYSYMFYGKGHKRKELLNFSKKLKTDEDTSSWINVAALNDNWPLRYDQSIFSLIRSSEPGKEDTLLISKKFSEYFESLQKAGISYDNILYNVQLYNAIHTLRNQYTSLMFSGNSLETEKQIPKNLQSYINMITWRPITSKEQYLADLGVSNLGDLVDYKDTKALFGSADAVENALIKLDSSGSLILKKDATTINTLEEEKARLQALYNYVKMQTPTWFQWLKDIIVIDTRKGFLRRAWNRVDGDETTTASNKSFHAQTQQFNSLTSAYIKAVHTLVNKGPEPAKKLVSTLLTSINNYMKINGLALNNPAFDPVNFLDALKKESPFHSFFTNRQFFNLFDVITTEGYKFTMDDLKKIEGLESVKKKIAEDAAKKGAAKTPDQKLDDAKTMSAMFKPYALIRRAHVIEGLKAFIIQSNKDTMVTT